MSDEGIRYPVSITPTDWATLYMHQHHVSATFGSSFTMFIMLQISFHLLLVTTERFKSGDV
jgi:hypothetical protein